MNSFSSLIINTRNHNKRASLAMPAQSNSLIKSLPIVNDYFVKFSLSNHCSMFDEQSNCINRKKDDQQYRRSPIITNTSANFRSAIFTNHQRRMNRYHPRGYISNLPASKQRLMIGVEHNQTIGLMQSREQTPLSSTPVHQLPSNCHPCIYENHYHQKKFLPLTSARIRLALRCSCLLDEKQQQQFDEIFSNNDQTTNISERILDECLSSLTKTYSKTLIILSGQYREVHQIQLALISSTLTRLFHFLNEEQDKDLILRLNIQEFFHNKTSTCLFSSDDYSVSSPNETTHYLNNLCSNHSFNPLLITFLLQTRSSNSTYTVLNILLTNDHDNQSRKELFSDILMSLALSTRQKQKKRNLTIDQSLSSLLNEYLSKHFVYFLANVKNEKQIKYWSKIQRLIRIKRNRLKMSRERYDSSSLERIINRNKEEIWIDGPLSSHQSKKEIWIDGPPEFCSQTNRPRSSSYRQVKPSILSPKHPFSSSSTAQKESSSTNFDTESIISSHCHLPVLPVFKDHSLLPFRSNQTLPQPKPLLNETPKLDLRLSTNKLNDDMELLEKTLETLLIPSPIVPVVNEKDSNISQSLTRIDQLSSMMTNDEKSKRLSRIVSPTRFEKILTGNQSSHWIRSSSSGSSVPNSPLTKSKVHHARTPSTSIPNTPHRSLLSTKKPKILSQHTRQTVNTRPSLFQRLFGLRTSSTLQQPIPIVIESPPVSPLISPLTVTLDSRDDLMPLTTSSTTSSASGRASSSGYESMSNTVLEDMIASIPAMITSENNAMKLRSKSIRKDDRSSNSNTLWNSPNLRDKSQRQQRLSQLKHRQNELKLELAMTKTFLLMDKNKTSEYHDPINSTIANPPMQQVLANTNEEDQLEEEIDHLERRLASTKSQFVFVTSQKTKQSKS